MVRRIISPGLIKFDARPYFKAVRKAFHDEPAKYSQFVKLWYYTTTHKLDRASAIAMVKEHMKDHPNLILGFYAFLPPEANKGFGQSQTMVGRRRTPDATMDAAFYYAVDLMEAFYAEPEKFDEFTKLLKDLKAHRVDVATGYARLGELLKDHRNLLIGLNAFRPAEAKITIPPEANTIIALEAKKPTHSDVMDYLKKTKEALHDEPAKFEEFMKLLDDIKTRRLGVDNAVAKLEELMKYHPNVLLGFYFLFPNRKKTISPEVKTNIAPAATRTIPPETKTAIAPEAKNPTLYDPRDLLKKTKEAFHDEPAKYEEFKKLWTDYGAHRLDFASAVAKLEELMKDHPNLLRGFYFLFLKRKKTIRPEAEQQAAVKNNKRERALNFVRKLKGIGYHVFVSFSVIMEIYRDGNMSRDKVYHEVAAILRAQGHEDLAMELPEFFNVIAEWPASTEDS